MRHLSTFLFSLWAGSVIGGIAGMTCPWLAAAIMWSALIAMYAEEYAAKAKRR